MNEAKKNGLENVVFAAAFSGYEDEYFASLPSAEELNDRYPLPRKELRSVEKYFKMSEKIKKYGRPLYSVYLRRAVAVILIAVSVLFASLMMNEKVRAEFGNAIVRFFEKYVRISIPEEQTFDESDSLSIYDLDVLSAVPDNYKNVNVSESNVRRVFDFVNDDGSQLCIRVVYSKSVSIDFDSEYSTFKKSEINGYETYIQIESREPRSVFVAVFKKNIVLIINGYEREEIMTAIAGEIIK
ncbi:MAG: DUF4367 domain-containing protein [Clostridia bacterium]|nr:DUF4367 domain-containing protein [Clostridia bacterium]